MAQWCDAEKFVGALPSHWRLVGRTSKRAVAATSAGLETATDVDHYVLSGGLPPEKAHGL